MGLDQGASPAAWAKEPPTVRPQMRSCHHLSRLHPYSPLTYPLSQAGPMKSSRWIVLEEGGGPGEDGDVDRVTVDDPDDSDLRSVPEGRQSAVREQIRPEIRRGGWFGSRLLWAQVSGAVGRPRVGRRRFLVVACVGPGDRLCRYRFVWGGLSADGAIGWWSGVGRGRCRSRAVKEQWSQGLAVRE